MRSWATGFFSGQTAFRALVAIAVVAVSATGARSAGEEERDEEYHLDYIYGVPLNPSQAWIQSSGGRLYDNWMNALEMDEPERNHPAWPTSNTTQSGAVTWRCKSCHGWDYKGKDGKYSTGSYETGIRGVLDVRSRYTSAEEVARLIEDENHGFSNELIPRADKLRLATFLLSGLHDTDIYIDPGTGDTTGNPARGRQIFQNVCAACHGFDGRALDWGPGDGESAFVGTEANANPWEVLHKIRNGHPGFEMVSLRAFPMEDAVNVLAYIRTLPQD